MTKFLRPIGYSELLTEYINHVTPHNIVAIGKINSPISPDVVMMASSHIVRKYPILHSHIGYDECFAFYENNGDQDDYFHFSHHHTKDKELDSLIEENIQCQLTEKNKIFMGVTQLSSDFDTTILLTLQHTICDGISIISLLSELIDIIDKLISKNKIDIKTTFLKPSLDDLLFHKQIKIKKNLYFQNDITSHIYSESTEKRYTGIKKMVINLERRNKIVKRAKEKSMTVTTLILYLLIITLKSNIINQADYIGANVMIDLRKYIDQVSKCDLGFYCGYVHIDFESNINCNEELAKKINTQINAFLKKNIVLRFSMEYKSFLESSSSIKEIIEKIKVNTPSVGISNTRIIATNRYKNFTLEEISFAVSCHAYSQTEDTFFVCMNTYGDNIYINFHHPMPIFTRERMNKITDEFFHAIDLI